MANDGNKAGEVFVEIKADTKPVDATLAALPAKAKAAAEAASAAVASVPSVAAVPGVAASGVAAASAAGRGRNGVFNIGGAHAAQEAAQVAAALKEIQAAEVAAGAAGIVAGEKMAAGAATASSSYGGLLKAVGFVKMAMMRIAMPVAIAIGVVKLIEYMDQLAESAKRVGESYAKIGNEEGRSVAKRIRDIKGEKDAVQDLLEETNAYINKLKEKRDADLEEWGGIGGALKAAAINRRQEDIIANIGDAYEVAADKARGFFTAVQNAQIDKAADDAEKAAKKARDTARLASMTGEDAIMEKSYQDVEALEEKKAKAKSDRERDAYDEQIALVLEVAEYAAEKERKSHEQKLDDIAREHAEERSSIERIAQARSQALVDFNNQARTSLNDLLSTAGIQTGMDKIANILLAIKSSQGAV